MRKITATLEDFEDWLRERGHDKLMGEDNFRIYIQMGLASLFFNNSSLLMSYILNQLGFPAERINDRVRFEVARRVREIKVDFYRFEISIEN
jgi:hypothetical protein